MHRSEIFLLSQYQLLLYWILNYWAYRLDEVKSTTNTSAVKEAAGHHGVATALSFLLFWSHKQVCDVPLKYITLHQLQVHTYV